MIAKYAFRVVVIMAMFIGSVSVIAVNDGSKAVHIRGSTTLQSIAQRVAEHYMAEHPDATIVISGGGTARGYKAVLDGTADIGMVSGDPPEDIANEAERRKLKFIPVTVGYEALVTVVHPSNPVNNLRMDQLKNIFTGRIKNWKEVGGKDGKIEVLIGPPTGGITESWKKMILGDEDTYTPQGKVYDNAPRATQMTTSPLAITFLTFVSVKPGIKILNVDGVVADASSVLDGRYHLRVPLVLITSEKTSPATQAFIKYFSTPRKVLTFDGIIHVGADKK